MSGHVDYIAVHTKLKDWEWYTDLPTKALFLHLLLCASRQDKQWQGKTIHRGEAVVGRNMTSKQCGISERQYRTAFDKLLRTGEISTSKTTNRFTIVRVNNFDTYQPKTVCERPAKTPTSDQQATTSLKKNKEEKEDLKKNSQKESSETAEKQNGNGAELELFDEGQTPNPSPAPKPPSTLKRKVLEQQAETIYQAYPRKVGKPAALSAITKALRTTDYDKLLKSVRLYATSRKDQDKQYTPYPQKWFNQQRYNDHLTDQASDNGTGNTDTAIGNSSTLPQGYELID